MKTRVLVAFENEWRIFRDAIAYAIRIHRPRVEVAAAELSVLGSKVACFDPHLVSAAAGIPFNTADPPGENCPTPWPIWRGHLTVRTTSVSYLDDSAKYDFNSALNTVP